VNYYLRISCSLIVGLFLIILTDFFANLNIEILSKPNEIDISLGISSGDVSSKSAVLWSKTNMTANMNIMYSPINNFINYTKVTFPVTNTSDYSGKYQIVNLQPETEYYYKIWFSNLRDTDHVSKTLFGKFKTAPNINDGKNISFAVGGDLGGQGYCIKMDIGYPIFRTIKDLHPDFFIANGDMIYADGVCPKEGPDTAKGWKNIQGAFPSILNRSIDWEDKSSVYSVFSEHWKYNKKEKHYQDLYRNVPIYAQADDHEVSDDYSGNSTIFTKSSENRSGFQNIVNAGMDAFFNYSPITVDNDEPQKIYRSFNWGKNLDLFLVDAHQYKSSGYLIDDEENNKTLLGHKQMDWLRYGLENSNSTWKVISMNVPISVPHCVKERENGCNNWATNNKTDKTFTRERNEFLKFLDDENIENVIFVVTDAHYAANILIDQDMNGDDDRIKIYELISGPLNAGTFGPDPLDRTINASYLYNETGFFNFGFYEIKEGVDNKTHFISQIVNSDGLIRKDSILDLVPN
jgi:alkaline phosphatase D